MEVAEQVAESNRARLRAVLPALGIPAATWYYRPVRREIDGRRPRRLVVPGNLEQAVVAMAEANPWYGYKRTRVMCRRNGTAVTDRQTYATMSAHGLLHKRRRLTMAGQEEASKLYEHLPMAANELWQIDITVVHLPGHGWWYAVTVIDYDARFLLALRLTWSYSANEVIAALEEARATAEAIHGPLRGQPFLVTDKGSCFSLAPSGARCATTSPTSGSSTERRRSSGYWSASTKPSRTKRWTGVYTTGPSTLGGASPSFTTARTMSDHTGHCARQEVIPWSRPTCTCTGGESGSHAGKHGHERQSADSTSFSSCRHNEGSGDCHLRPGSVSSRLPWQHKAITVAR